MGRQQFDGYWRGILARAGHPRATPPGFVRDALNIGFPGGAPRSRPAIRPWHGAAFAGPVRGMGFHVQADGTRELLIAAGDAIQRVQPYGDPVTLPLTSLPSALQTRIDPTAGVRFLSLSGGANQTFIFDGVNPNLKWDGTALTQMGLGAGLTVAVASTSAVGGGITNGTRKYVMTLDSGVHEGNPSLSPTSYTNAGGTATQSNTVTSPTALAIDDPQVTRWKLWRTQAGGAKYFFVNSAPIGTNIVDTLSDTTLTAGTPLELFVNAPPPSFFTSLTEHGTIVFGVAVDDENLVRYSHSDPQYMVPESWPTENVIPVAHGDGDRVTAVVSFFEWIVVFKETSTYAISGNLADGFQVTPVLAAGGGKRFGIGCFAPGSILNIENLLIFASRDGFYAIDRFASMRGGIQATRLSGAIDDLYGCANFALGSASSFDRKKRTYMFWGHG